jgi:hypothetical protein
MSKTRVSLEPELQRKAQRRAAELGVSLAEYIRSLVARDLRGRRRKRNVSLVFNLGSSAPEANVARQKDEMAGEAVAAGRRRRRPKR